MTDYTIYHYLLSNILNISNINLSIDENTIKVYFNDLSYQEKLVSLSQWFDNIDNRRIMDEMHRLASEGKKITLPEKFPYIQLILFFLTEKYLKSPLQKDKYDRITSKSVDEKFVKYLEIPITDILINLFLKKLNVNNENKIRIILTSDFDFINLWDKLGFLRSIKRLINWLLSFQFKLFKQELISYMQDNKKLKYNYILPLGLFDFDNKNVDARKIAFWLMNFRNQNIDFRNNFNSSSFHQFLDVLNKQHVELGLHPSFGSSDNKELINQDIIKFQQVFKQEPKISRYHYLSYNYPEDLTILEEFGIKEDYSYCFPDSLHFRGGRTFPVKPWSEKLNRPVNVLSYPITIMDVVFKYYLNQGFEEAKKSALEKLKITLNFGSHCVLLFHNNYQYKYYEKNNYLPELYAEIKKYIADYFNEKDNDYFYKN
ncbi:MAG: hypothetical protein Kow0068_08480 [Marinilabiliales bacterium]